MSVPPSQKPERMERLRAIVTGRDTMGLRNIGLLIAAIVAVSAIFWLSAQVIGLDENGILSRTFRSFADSPWALPVVALTFTAASFIGAPQFLLIAVTVAAFGATKGFIFSVIATLISASVNFHVARFVGADWLRNHGWTGLTGLSGLIGRNGFMASLLARIIPSAPFIVVNMGLSFTNISFLAFFSGTAIGILPKTTLIALLGKVLERAQSGDPQAIIYLVLAALGWITLAFFAKWILRSRQ